MDVNGVNYCLVNDILQNIFLCVQQKKRKEVESTVHINTDKNPDILHIFLPQLKQGILEDQVRLMWPSDTFGIFRVLLSQ